MIRLMIIPIIVFIIITIMVIIITVIIIVITAFVFVIFTVMVMAMVTITIATQPDSTKMGCDVYTPQTPEMPMVGKPDAHYERIMSGL